MERQLVFEDFKDRVGSIFTLCESEVPRIPLELHEATLLPANFAPPGVRPPFSLRFIGVGEMILPQRLYRLWHAETGEVTIFLVPIAKGQGGVTYEATFN